MVYSFLRIVCRFLLYVFYSEITVTGEPDPGGPLILVANHPSTLNDALLIACQLDRPVSIIAKASLFDNPIAGWILRNLGVLPVVRRGFEAKKSGPAPDNDDTFQAIYECLAENGVVLIFPEGTSHLERKLFKVKTGAARMALGAEKQFGPLGVQIVPVGLNYEDPQAFGAAVRLRFGEAIPATPFLVHSDGDNRKAARKMTDQIQMQLTNEMIHLENPEYQHILMTVHRWVGENFVAEGTHRLDVLRKIAKVINYYNQHEPERIKHFESTIESYYKLLKENNLSDKALDDPIPVPFITIVAGVLVFPFWFYGAANHYIPYKIPRYATKFLNIDPVYDSTVKLFTGVISFTLMYVLQTALVWYFTSNSIAIAYFLSLPIFGMLSLQCLQTYYHLKARRKYNRRLNRADRAAVLEALKIRSQLLRELSKAEKDYFAAMHQDKETESSDSQIIHNAVEKSLNSGVSGRVEWQQTSQNQESEQS